MIWLRALLFGLVVPGTVAGLAPFAIARSDLAFRLPPGPWALLGLLALAVGWTGLLWCFRAFVVRGRGTPAPYEPPRELVAVGLYRYVRNPMYLSVLLAVAGAGFWLRSGAVLLYAVALAAGFHLFVRFYEEPRLHRQFGEAYDRYVASVPRWVPRATRGRPSRPAT